MRILSLFVPLFVSNAAIAAAQEAAPASGGGGLMSLQVNLMFWTLLVFALLYFILSRYAFGPIMAAVEKREKALEEAIDAAKRDRDAAAKLLQEHQAAIEAARGEGQKLIADSRAVAEKLRTDLIEQTHREQQDMLERARRELESEKVRAIAEMRREAVDLALAGATKVIEQNLQTDSNRRLVESYLSQLGNLKVSQ
jgi:F-type H+-transporting ATPase subunit b